jgi:asparagine synthase (glutamine-hydrolysing)
MCGIVGIVPREPTDLGELEALVRRMAEAVRHRGPDEDGFLVTPEIALGMRRLRIIDVKGGQQPILTPDGSRAIVYNGEIYNFRTVRRELENQGCVFRTVSDTEVVLHALDRWGTDGIRRLEGMFAFAVWDAERKRLTLARDWLGQKSIYYAETRLGWVFASEIKALLTLDLIPREVDLVALSHFMSLRYLPVPRTLFAGISKVPAAHWAEVSATERRFTRYWKPAYDPKWKGSETEVIDELDSLMKNVVAEHLMSEVPLGAFLSGGIDSSLVVAYAALASEEPVRTFSIGVNEASQSELPWAKKVAERYATRHFERVIDPDLAGLAPRMVAVMEEPVDPFATGVYLVSQITAEHVTVALGGDGGDELFAGYDRYLGQSLAETYARIPAGMRRRVLRPLLRLIPESFGYKSFATKLRWLDQMAERDGEARYAESAAFLRFPHALKANLFTERVWKSLESAESERLLDKYFHDGSAEEFLDKMLHVDCMTRLAEHQLPIVDRMSMAHSLEVRSPFLDRRVTEYAMRIPASWKMRSRRIKYVTRKMGERYLSRDLLYRPKQGFGFPLALWFRDRWRPWIEELARSSRIIDAGLFRQEEIQRLVDEHVGGRIDHNYRLWLLLNTELWYRHFIDREPVAALEEWVDQCQSVRA